MAKNGSIIKSRVEAENWLDQCYVHAVQLSFIRPEERKIKPWRNKAEEEKCGMEWLSTTTVHLNTQEVARLAQCEGEEHCLLTGAGRSGSCRSRLLSELHGTSWECCKWKPLQRLYALFANNEDAERGMNACNLDRKVQNACHTFFFFFYP